VGRVLRRDVELVLYALVCLAVILGLFLANQKMFDSFEAVIRTMIFEKLNTGSGIERAYWNTRSLQSFQDTFGLGVGMGSSRSSSWAVSVLSQLGIIGAALMAALIGYLVVG